jgi:glycosyltransferase involved in cell wall biosynthesis
LEVHRGVRGDRSDAGQRVLRGEDLDVAIERQWVEGSVRPMRVLHVIDALSIGGAERHVVDLARRQSERGDEVAIACSAGGELAAELEGTPVPVHVLGDTTAKRRVDLGYAGALRRLVGDFEPDLVHAHLYASIVAAVLATAGRAVPLVVTEQTEAPWRGARERLASRLAYRRAAHLIAVSERIRNGLVDGFGLPPAKATTIPNAVALANDGGATKPLPEWRGQPVVGVCGRLVPEKGIDIFLEAVADLARRFPEATFPIIGDGPLRADLEARVRALGLTDRVPFAGFRDDCRALLPRLDVLAVPSRSEGTPLTIVEAMHAGVALVATTVGGIPEQLTDGETALLVEPADAATLASAIARVLTEPGLAEHLAATAREHARVEFHPDAMLRRIDAVYAAVQAAAGAPARLRTSRSEPPGRRGPVTRERKSTLS